VVRLVGGAAAGRDAAVGSIRRKGRCSKNQQEENDMTTDAHRCRVCGKLSEDDDGMVRVGVRRWKHFRCLRLIGVDAILKTVSVQECKPLDQTTLVALDLQTVAVGLLSTRDWPTRSATASRCSAISHARSAGRRAKPCSPMSRAWRGDRGDREGRSRWVQAPRQARSVALPEREPGMTRTLSAGLLVALLSAMPAAADHCPPGQFYRVRLNRCVGLNTRLASAYVHAAASRLATPGSGDKAALSVEPEAKPVGEPKIVIPFVLPTLNDWPAPK
jgi:hypothetical protein